MEILQSRTEPLDGSNENNGSRNRNQNAGSKWTKARRYLYHRSDLSASQVIEVVDFLEDVLQEDRWLMANVIQSNPRILRFNVERFLEPTALFLENLYGEELFLEAVRRNPGILLTRGVGCDAPEQSIVSIENFFVSSLGLRNFELTGLKEKAPWLFQRSLEDMQSTVKYIERILQCNGKSEDTNRKTIGKLLRSYPTLFNLSVDNGLAPKVDFLQQECGLSKTEVASLFQGHRAAVFCLSVEDSLRESTELLKELLGPGASQQETMQRLRKCIVAHPNILCLSEPNLMEKISYFNQIDSVCPSKSRTSLASRIAIRSPTVYSLSLQDNIIPKVDFLAWVWGVKVPNSQEEEDNAQHTELGLATLLAESPSILTMSLEGNIQPTINFYNRTEYTRLDENWNLREDGLLVRGRYIASSLFQRLLPRWHYYLMNKDRYGTPCKDLKMPPLHILAGSSDAQYCEHLQVELSEYMSFKEEAVPRLKFSSQFDTWLKTGRPID